MRSRGRRCAPRARWWLPSGRRTCACRPSPTPDGIEFTTYSVLPAGSEVIVNLRRGDLMLTVKEDRMVAVEMDKPAWVTFNPECINLYDKRTTALIPVQS